MPERGLLIVNTADPEDLDYTHEHSMRQFRRIFKGFSLRATNVLKHIGPVEEQGVILNGSPRSVNEKAPWLEAYIRFVKDLESRGKPILGICLGHQVLALAHGYEVSQAPEPVFDHEKLILDSSAFFDPLFSRLPTEFEIPSAHFEVATGFSRDVTRARSTRGHTYAFRAHDQNGKELNAWGLQFHPETHPDRLATIISQIGNLNHSPEEIRSIRKRKPSNEGQMILKNFAKIVRQSPYLPQ